MSKVTRGDKTGPGGKLIAREQLRPNWIYPRRSQTEPGVLDLLERMESTRNVLEDVKSYLRDLTSLQRDTNTVLKRMERRHLRERREDRQTGEYSPR